ncbi:hypothetical protein FGB62_187g014 [Gracilaria domingensis]|nr:hypothetical protein FGB62_187g014 [Gracilaria domingensis]
MKARMAGMTNDTRKKEAKAKGCSPKATVGASNKENEANEDLPIACWPRKSAVAKVVGHVHQHANSNLNAAKALVALSDGCSGRNGV